ncbi:hypothetical protein FF011L_03320 [Roseimaritima multifibrata]|uniref:Uncharacterized protein n=1 Tax=Roseimaritima multifibrata TaxID=1930274 RepID=A0A517M9P2_9BACT|nr:hypothetical protein [Roseimaritima multifibrata]QDS91602.1 hypothetical protein FF011L_03320 [Roseimaritima multifibrata]
MADLDGDAIITKYCGFLGDRVRYDADLSTTVLADLRRAVVVVNAFWSGPSMQTLIRVAKLLDDVDSHGCAQLIVCDTDHIPDLAAEPWLLDTHGGMGEIAWVLNGRIVARRDPSRNPDLRVTTWSFISECPA